MSTRTYLIVAPLGYVMDYISSSLGFALFISWLCHTIAFPVYLAVFGWVIVAMATLTSVMNFIPSCVQAYRNSLGYSQERRMSVWTVLAVSVLSYAIAAGTIFTHRMSVGIVASVVNTVAMVMLCSMTHSTPRWSFRPRKTDEEIS